MEELSKCWPAMAVPITVKIPAPITAPMPSAVSDHGPRVFRSLVSGRSESDMSLSMDFLANNWFGSDVLRDYRFAVPRTIFLTFCFFEPRRYSRGFLGACFLRAARLAFLRSSRLSFLVLAMISLFYDFPFSKGQGRSILLERLGPRY